MTAPKNKKPITKLTKPHAGALLKSSARQRHLLPRLSHRRHSFKLLPNHHTSYPLLLFTLLLVGIFSIGWTAFASGDVDGGAYVVTAVVPAAPLPTAAEITAPSDGDVFHTQIITVSGNCPDNSYIKLYRNHVFSGTALCQSNNNWYIQISLVPGTNTLYARDYNVTDQAGPMSHAISVTYDPPVPAAPASDSTGAVSPPQVTGHATAPSPAVTPLVLTSEYTYSGVAVGQTLHEALELDGGTGPYAVSIDWGDGSTDLVSRSQAGAFTVDHSYTDPGGYHNSYVIKVSASDASGQTSVLQMLAIVTEAGTGEGSSGLAGLNGQSGSSMDGSGGHMSPFARFWRVATPVYVVSFVGISSFWLGENREFELLRRHAVRLHRRRPLR